jgi:hypothetical protein
LLTLPRAGPLALSLALTAGLVVQPEPAAATTEGTGAWTTWQTVATNANLNAGNNIVRATATTVNGGPDVDFLTVGDASPPPSTGTMAAEPYEHLGWGNPQRPTATASARCRTASCSPAPCAHPSSCNKENPCTEGFPPS